MLCWVAVTPMSQRLRFTVYSNGWWLIFGQRNQHSKVCCWSTGLGGCFWSFGFLAIGNIATMKMTTSKLRVSASPLNFPSTIPTSVGRQAIFVIEKKNYARHKNLSSSIFANNVNLIFILTNGDRWHFHVNMSSREHNKKDKNDWMWLGCVFSLLLHRIRCNYLVFVPSNAKRR